MTTNLYFDGGTKHGTTQQIANLDDDLAIDFGGPGSFLDATETYERTSETIKIDGTEHTVYRLV
ncbi:hypothetical protein PUR49_05395 [Streptomyces sp. BE147]|uniref:hypothetical protein n=1 Tax=Streptomyces sp. BE147 TaxID=3002524 RepID=UPI002E7781EF|nr:hypothetical protein [Streptomyces sp. BE147]MEE1735949.1 hypothetical protein [Streptomyces sp. BE147]